MPKARATRAAHAAVSDRRPTPRCGPAPGRRFLARQPFMNQPLQCLDALAFGRQRRVRAHLLRDPQRVSGIELAVEIGIHQ